MPKRYEKKICNPLPLQMFNSVAEDQLRPVTGPASREAFRVMTQANIQEQILFSCPDRVCQTAQYVAMLLTYSLKF